MFINLFLTFFKIGLFSFGGGYAMLPLIKHEVVDVNGWMTSESFTNIIGISQVTPGPVAVNTATYVGYKTSGILGSACATLGVIMPSAIIIFIISKLFMKHNDNKYVDGILKYIRLSAVGLIAAAAVMLRSDVTANVRSFLIFVTAFILNYKFKLDPILLAILSGIAGFILF
ncbi:MAG: chromate transporter [Clostridium sp.]